MSPWALRRYHGVLIALIVFATACGKRAEPLPPSAYQDATGGDETPAGAAADPEVAADASAGPAAIDPAAPPAPVPGEAPAAGEAAAAEPVEAPAGPPAASAAAPAQANAKPAPAEASEASEAAPTVGSVAVIMTGFAHADGQVLVALWRTKRGFPEQARRAFGKQRTRVRGKRARVVFEDVPPGPFAVVVHHDEDKDFEMDTGLMGIPQEGYGFSRDAAGNFGPPSFEDARVWLRAGQERRVRIRMRY